MDYLCQIESNWNLSIYAGECNFHWWEFTKIKSEYFFSCANEFKSIRFDDFFQSVIPQQLKRNKAVKKYARLQQFFPALFEGSRCMGACAYCASQCWCAVSAPVFSTSRSDNAHARFDARGRCQWIVSGISLMFSWFGPACSFNLTQFLYIFCWNFSKFKITAVKVYVFLSFYENCRALMYKI